MWYEFSIALFAFLASHAIPMLPPLRARLIDTLGRGVYFAAYSILSLGLLIWLFIAAGRAPYLPVWPALRAAPVLGMPVVCWLIAEGLLHPNGLSLGRRGKGPHPLAPLTRHPLPLALVLWAGLHMVANPDLAHVILFGLLGMFSLLSMQLIDRRNQRILGRRWTVDAKGSAMFNPLGVTNIRASISALGLGAGIYALFVVGHPFFAGVPALVF